MWSAIADLKKTKHKAALTGHLVGRFYKISVLLKLKKHSSKIFSAVYYSTHTKSYYLGWLRLKEPPNKPVIALMESSYLIMPSNNYNEIDLVLNNGQFSYTYDILTHITIYE